ncbi:unnamed protein product [Musa acuminata subsp. burmannicoides]
MQINFRFSNCDCFSYHQRYYLFLPGTASVSISSVFLLYKQMELLALKYLVVLKKLVIKAGNVC